jgi:acyl transferase domain-containing protein
VPGEGVGVVLLKRMNDALRDGDHIYGVIKTSRANQDGKTNGLIAPSSVSQHLFEKEVYSHSNINPETISYVETHGTGTSLGDPIEFDALSKSFKFYTDKKQFCSIGSVKTNVGHTLMAAGVAGLVAASAGGKAVVAASKGLWKIILAGIVALGAFIFGLFSRKK